MPSTPIETIEQLDAKFAAMDEADIVVFLRSIRPLKEYPGSPFPLYILAGAAVTRLRNLDNIGRGRFQEIILQDLEVSMDEAGRLRSVYQDARQSWLSADQLRGITVSAMRLLRPVFLNYSGSQNHSDDVVKFLKYARGHTIRDLKSRVSLYLNQGDDTPNPPPAPLPSPKPERNIDMARPYSWKKHISVLYSVSLRKASESIAIILPQKGTVKEFTDWYTDQEFSLPSSYRIAGGIIKTSILERWLKSKKVNLDDFACAYRPRKRRSSQERQIYPPLSPAPNHPPEPQARGFLEQVEELLSSNLSRDMKCDMIVQLAKEVHI